LKIKLRSNSLGRLLLFVGLFLLILFLHIRLNPATNIVGQESGVFYYSGQRILQGDILYRDLWDVHPPGMHYLNALVMKFNWPTPWVMWWLEIVFLTTTAYILFFVVRRFLPLWLSLGMVLVFLGTVHDPTLLSDVNFGELFAVLPQVAGIYLLVLYLETNQLRWIFLLGLSAAIALLFNPASVILGLAALIVSAVHHPQRLRIKMAASGLAGVAVLPISIIACWAFHGSLNDLISVLVYSNAARLSSALSIRSVYAAIRQVAMAQPLALLFALTGGTIFFYLGGILRRRGLATNNGNNLIDQMDQTDSVLINYRLSEVISLALPIEILLVNLSGHNHGHYYLMTIPSLVIGSAVLLAKLSTKDKGDDAETGRILIGVVSVLVLGWLINTIQSQALDLARINRLTQVEGWSYIAQPGVADYIFSHTEHGESVLVWSRDIQVNFLTGRRSPSRFLSPNTVFEMAPISPEHVSEFVESIESASPELVLVPPGEDNLPNLFDLRQSLCPQCAGDIQTELEVWTEFMVGHYVWVQELDGWDIFQWVN
jgi:hypothetical protein